MQYLDYRETCAHGSEDFPFAFYHITPNQPRYIMQPHWHDEYEIVRVLEGSMILSMNQLSFRLTQGDTAFISSGFLHHCMPFDCQYDCVVFDMEYYMKKHNSAKDIFEPIINQTQYILPFFSKEREDFQELFSAILEGAAAKTVSHRLIAEGALYQFLGMVFKEDAFVDIPEHFPTHTKKLKEIKRVLNYISLRYADPITLEDMADCLNMTPNYFCRFFKDMTHKSPVEYLNFYRIEVACEKLSTTNDSVLNTALKCGFSDVNYFIKVFKKYKGTTPLKYTKKKIG